MKYINIFELLSIKSYKILIQLLQEYKKVAKALLHFAKIMKKAII